MKRLLKNRIRLLLAALALVMILMSCSYEKHDATITAGNNTTQSRKWTVLYYGVSGSHTSDSTQSWGQTIQNITDLESFPDNREVQFVSLALSDSAHPSDVQYCPLAYHPGPGIQSPQTDWGSIPMSNRETLRRFIDSATIQFPAQKYALLVSGYGVGINGICYTTDESGSSSFMSLSDFREAIATSDIQHLETTVFAMAQMGQIEISYELSDVTNYCVVTSTLDEHTYSLAARYWVNDLLSQTDADGKRVSELIADGLYQESWEPQSSKRFSCLDTRQSNYLSSQIDSLGTALNDVVSNEYETLNHLRTQVWEAGIDDSSSVDLKKYLNAIINSTEFTNYPVIQHLAQDIESQIDNNRIYLRPNNNDAINPVYPVQQLDPSRAGLSIYYPSSEPSNQYNSLLFNQNHTSWIHFVTTTNNFETAHSVTVAGTLKGITLPVFGEIFRDVYVFLDTTSLQRPNVFASKKLVIGDDDPFMVNDTTEVLYRTRIPLPSGITQIRARLWAFQDMNRNGLLDSGDKYGFNYTSSRFIPAVYNIAAGDSLTDKTIILSYTY